MKPKAGTGRADVGDKDAIIAPARSRDGYSVRELHDLGTPTGGGIAQDGRALSAHQG